MKVRYGFYNKDGELIAERTGAVTVIDPPYVTKANDTIYYAMFCEGGHRVYPLLMNPKEGTSINRIVSTAFRESLG